MTRARAAAKAGSGSTATKTTKVVTASAKAAAATRLAPSTKRKMLSDETDDDDEEPNQTTNPSTTTPANTMDKPAKTRGRPKKIVEPQFEPAAPAEDAASATARATRGRAKKAPTEAPKPEPAKTTRTRIKKTQTEDDSADAPAQPAKKTARGRAASGATATKTGTICTTVNTNPTPGLKSAVSRPASRISTVKKSVKFQEPEKENQVHAAASKAKDRTVESATGMRARPVRKPAAGARATRASTRTTSTDATKVRPVPLSPKKDGQNRPLSRGSSSDDELATLEKTPLKPMMKSPIKLPNSARKMGFAPPANQQTSETEENTAQPSESAATAAFGSPAKRPPPSPFKDVMNSPAKRVDGLSSLLFSTAKGNAETNQSPFKSSLLQSPAKRPQLPMKAFQASSNERSVQPRSPMKMSLMRSPAKRPMSPFKVLGSPVRSMGSKSAQSSAEEAPQADADDQFEFASSEPAKFTGADPDDIEMSQEDEEEEGHLESPAQLEFPGRLSAVLPRDADPALQDKALSLVEDVEAELEPSVPDHVSHEPEADPEHTPSEPQVVATEPVLEDAMDIDDTEMEDADPLSPQATTPPRSTVRAMNPMFGLRQKDLLAFDNYESEDELASSGKNLLKFQDDDTLTMTTVGTPTPGASKTPSGGLPSSAIKNAGRAIRSVSRGSKLGFTPLARQLSEWRAGSPLKLGNTDSPSLNREVYEEENSLVEADVSAVLDVSPAKGTFFEDAMKVHADADAGADADAEGDSDAQFDEAAMEAALEADIAASYEPVFDDVPFTNEDVELAAEANDMSLMEPEQVEEMLDIQTHDDSISETSQEYGDENAIPIDPALLGATAGRPRHSMAAVPPVTPMRPSTTRPFNTTTKVPLKPADDSTPRSMKRRSHSVSRLPVKRPAGPTRNATVISYSPTKDAYEDPPEQEARASDHPPVTPSKSDIWSSAGTPAHTPRRDLDSSLLRGAVVFVDVHTSEGADASTVFVDLLTQMGARCVKSWPWNPSSPTNGEAAASKIGITHVVYKDGGKRTMEKVRESGGVVQCVGVGWVLE